MNKFYVCESDSIFDIADWNKEYTHSDRVRITKSDLSESIDIVKAVTGAQNPTGNTWSQELVRKNAPARWITYRGNRVLIKLNADGTGRVIFSANPSFEHLRIIPKTHEEYKNIVKEKDKEEAKRKEKEEITPEQLQKEKEVKKEAKKQKEEVKEQFKQKIAEVLEVTEEDIANIEAKLATKAEKLLAREERKEVESIFEDIQEKSKDKTTAEKTQVDKALIEAAEKTLHDEATGNDLIKQALDTKTGDDVLDEALNMMRRKMTVEQAVEIVSAKTRKKQYEKEIRDLYKDDMVTPKGNLELTSTQGIGIIDFDEPTENAKDKAVEAALKSEEAKLRANLNTQFYEIVEDREGKKSTINAANIGTKDTVNAMAGLYLEGASLNDELIEFVGTSNASKIIANSVSAHTDDKKFVKKMEDFISKRSGEVVKEVLEDVKERKERMDNYRDQKDDGMLAGSTANAAVAREYGQLGKEVGFAIGSLEAAATVLDAMRDIKESTGDIIVDGGKDYNDLKDKLEGFGLEEGDYNIKKVRDGERKGRYDAIIFSGSQEKMLTENTFSKERDKEVEDIKTGKAHEEGWLPKGMNKQFTDFIDSSQYENMKKEVGAIDPKNMSAEEKKLKDKFDSFSEYKNKKGADGYSSDFKNGETLYGRKLDVKAKDHQQRMIKMAMSQKRVVWNAGAGTGKTFAYLGAVSELKASGKLDKSYAVMSPPSRLRNEFFKDTEKFFPHMNVLNLDNVKGIDAKKDILDYAGRGEAHPKHGKIDLIITGHDSLKAGTSAKEMKSFVESQKDAYIHNLEDSERKKVAITGYWKDGKGKELEDGWKQQAKDNVGLPAVIANSKPVFTGMDEAHEAFKGDKEKESLRFSAVKQIMKDSEYSISGTGTVVKNKIDELGNLLHLTRPDVIKSPRQFSKKFKDVNQFTGVYQNQASEAMAKEYDKVMITEKLDLKPEYKQTKNKVKITKEQSDSYRDSEAMYRMDRDTTGFGVVSHETGELMMSGKDLHKFDNIPFTYGDTTSDKKSDGHKDFLKEQGYDHEKYRVVKLGKQGAAQRRDMRHERVINGGDYTKNAKAHEMMNVIKGYPKDKNHIMFYKNSWSKKMLSEMIGGLGYKPEQIAYVDGGIKGNKRQAEVKKFQRDPNVKFIVMNQAGMTGLNLQEGDVQHFLTRPDTYAEQQQAGARSYRTGREEDVNAHFYDSNTVIDDRKVNTINRKQKLSEGINEVRGDKEKREARKGKVKKGLYITNKKGLWLN